MKFCSTYFGHIYDVFWGDKGRYLVLKERRIVSGGTKGNPATGETCRICWCIKIHSHIDWQYCMSNVRNINKD